jgi:fumarate reductase flavoprotein subunit
MTTTTNDQELSRRNFLKGATVSAVSVAALGVISACSPKVLTDSPEQTATEALEPVPTENAVATAPVVSESLMSKVGETIEADVVVLGSGGSGSAAATRAAQLGLKTILLEKNAIYGGTSMFTEGLFALGSHWQKEAGIDYKIGEVFGKAMEYHHWLADGKLNHAFFEASAANLDWMEEVGIRFRAVSTLGVALTTWHLYEAEEGEVSGAKYVRMWQAAAENQGATIMLSTPGRELVMEDGKVAGMIAEKEDGSYIFIKAPVVILATGGYANNPESIDEFCDFSSDRIEPMGMTGRDGDGIRFGRAAGGKMAKAPGTLMFYGGTMRGLPYGTELYCAAAFQPFFWVNEQGLRFVTEELSEQNFTHSGNAQCMQKKVFSIVTKEQLDMFVNEGCVFGCGEYIKRGTKLTDLWNQINDWIEQDKGSIYIGDTLDELAEKIGVDAETLNSTVQRYNEFCKNGEDLDFAKDPTLLYALNAGPYYAFELVTGIFTTCGGLKINTKSQVLSPDGEAIPGLYAGGCDTGGLYGDTYDVGICAGSCQGFAVHTGKTAAENAVEYLGA